MMKCKQIILAKVGQAYRTEFTFDFWNALFIISDVYLGTELEGVVQIFMPNLSSKHPQLVSQNKQKYQGRYIDHRETFLQLLNIGRYTNIGMHSKLR